MTVTAIPWTLNSEKPYIELAIDGHTYKGVLVEQKVDNENYHTLTFTAVNEEELCIWGSMSSDARKVIAQNVKNFDFGVPESTYVDFTLPTEGISGATVSWSSSNPQILTAEGTIAAQVAEDTTVTLTATISKGEYYYEMTFPVVVKAGDGTFTERTLIASYFGDTPQELSGVMDGSLSVANPFYNGTTRGIDISGGVSVEFDVERTGDLHMLGTILAFMGSGRLYFTPGSYLGYNATGGYFDANVKDFSLVQDYLGDSAHVELKFEPDGFSVYVNGSLAYDEEILATENGGGTLTDYKKVLKWLNESADTLYFGYGSWWAGVGYDEANCRISNVKCYVEQTSNAPAEDSDCDKLTWGVGQAETSYWWTELCTLSDIVIASSPELVEFSREEVNLTGNDYLDSVDNPFQGKEILGMDMEYTLNFASDAAKNGWDGIFSFFQTASGGRVSVQTNPYVCFNSGNGIWMDLNSPGNVASGGTNWAAAAETGKDYKVHIKLRKNEAAITIDGENIALSVVAGSTDTSVKDILSFISDCDAFTFGVGLAQTAYWNTELATIKDFSAKAVCRYTEEDNDVSDPEDGEEEVSILALSENGWDGILSFYEPTTGARVSIQSAPYLCYNDMGGENVRWADINSPALEGSTDWAALAVAGETYHVEITVTADEVSMAVGDKNLTIAQNTSANFGGYQEILNQISACGNLTIGVRKAVASFWNSELCTISNLDITANDSGEEESEDSEEPEDTEDTEDDEADSGDAGKNEDTGKHTDKTSKDDENAKTESDSTETTYQGTDGKTMRRLYNRKYDKVIIEGENSVLLAGTTFTMQSIAGGSTFEQAAAAVKASLKGCSAFAVMEINLFDQNNEAIHQFNDYVKVTLPIPSEISAKNGKTIVVYRLEEDGSLTACDTTVSGDTATFRTNHFSTFILAERDTTAVAADTSDTGADWILFAMLLLPAGICTLWIFGKKKGMLHV